MGLGGGQPDRGKKAIQKLFDFAKIVVSIILAFFKWIRKKHGKVDSLIALTGNPPISLVNITITHPPPQSKTFQRKHNTNVFTNVYTIPPS